MTENTEGFRGSAPDCERTVLLPEFYAPFSTVGHFTTVTTVTTI